MSPRVAIVVLAVLVLVFVVAVGSGIGKPAGGSKKDLPDYRKSLASAFVQSEPMPVGDITSRQSSCLVAGRIRATAGATCVYRVAASSTAKRTMKLSGVGVYAFVPDLRGVDQNPDLRAFGDEVDIPGQGGKLTVRCTFGTCQQV
ncbi:MAG: hypothetical protein ABI838_03090 [Chloroflexota bacterium]